MDFKLHVLESITNNFSEESKVGSGAYGNVYKVCLLIIISFLLLKYAGYELVMHVYDI